MLKSITEACQENFLSENIKSGAFFKSTACIRTHPPDIIPILQVDSVEILFRNDPFVQDKRQVIFPGSVDQRLYDRIVPVCLSDHLDHV